MPDPTRRSFLGRLLTGIAAAPVAADALARPLGLLAEPPVVPAVPAAPPPPTVPPVPVEVVAPRFVMVSSVAVNTVSPCTPIMTLRRHHLQPERPSSMSSTCRCGAEDWRLHGDSFGDSWACGYCGSGPVPRAVSPLPGPYAP